MKSKEEINSAVEDTFNVLATIEEVKVNHFFKHKLLQQFEKEKEEKNSILGWFSPQLQLATLSIVLLLNIGAVFYAYSVPTTIINSSIESFAQEYALQSDTNSIFK